MILVRMMAWKLSCLIEEVQFEFAADVVPELSMIGVDFSHLAGRWFQREYDNVVNRAADWENSQFSRGLFKV
jgi:hypothetical protein